MLCLLLASVILLASQQQGNALTPLPGVKEYELVYPQKLYARHRRDTGAKYPDEIQYGLKVKGEDMVLHLERNEDLLTSNYTLTYYLPNGQEVTISSQIADHCYYHGYIKNEMDSEASISICNGVRGYFKTNGQRYLIEPLSVQEGEGHAVYKYESLENTPKTCGVTNTSYDVGIKTSRSAISTRSQEFLKSKKYIELYMVADNSIFNKYNQNKEMVESRIFEVINYVNLVYKAINTFVALTGIDIWSDRDQFDVNSSAAVNLDRFSAWRNEVLLKKKYNDNAQFLTNTDFDGPTVGLAFVGTMCSSDHSTGVIQDHTSVAISVGATVAHEMGHNLGMNHDTNACTCDEDSCIMAASLSYVTPKLFSTCSHQQFQDYILAKMPLCIKDKPSFRSVIAPPVCGNGFIESGEQCDCGLPEECQNPCCDATTCKLAPNAKCADGECCESCMIKKAGLVCRKRKDDCDIPENCDGASAACPADKFRVNGYPCKNGQGYCNQGTCPILENQCTDLWGQGAKVGSEQCFKANRRGVYYGYCAFTENSYIGCNAQDVQCGKLYCSDGLDTPLSVYASIIKLLNCKTLVPVNGVVKDNLGMVLNGTTCGNGKVCNLGHCVDLVKAYPRAVNCSSKCKGHAVCDHENMCQCEEGWAPPDCDVTSGTNITIIIVVVVLLVVTILIVIGLLWYRGTFKRKDKSSQLNTVSGVTNEAYQAKQKNPSVIVHTPELPTRSLLTTPSPPTPPGQANKPRISFMSYADGRHQQTKVGYSSPQYVVASPSPEPARNNRVMPIKPSAAPPPVPVSKPGNYGVMPKPPPIPTGKPVLPSAPSKALKPPTSRLNV